MASENDKITGLADGAGDRDNLKEKISGIDEETLKKIVFDIAKSMGFDVKSADRFAGNIPGMKKNLERMNNEDIDRLLRSLPREKADEILALLNNKKNKS